VIKEFGLGGAILVDAFIVRLILVPAVMNLLGEKAWYMPAWLDRILPRISVEGPSEDGGHFDGVAIPARPVAGQAD
jgi:RND superfamily putative drug exporter